jgi:hypothetical protein
MASHSRIELLHIDIQGGGRLGRPLSTVDCWQGCVQANWHPFSTDRGASSICSSVRGGCSLNGASRYSIVDRRRSAGDR